ncbi:Ribosomal large subunit pseudouridine synthase B, partial [Tetrabaena socialis]
MSASRLLMPPGLDCLAGRRPMLAARPHPLGSLASATASGYGREPRPARPLSTAVLAAVKPAGDGPSTSGRSSPADKPNAKPRLAKVLAACGVASRRACETLISEGRVRVNARVITEQGSTVNPMFDKVEVLQLPSKAASSGAAGGGGGGG